MGRFRQIIHDIFSPHQSNPPPLAAADQKMPGPKVPDIRQGLLAALKGDGDIVAFPTKLLYQFEDAKPYNLDYPIVPAAVTYPKTSEQIAEIVRFASEAGIKVQARSGGHSYANYGILPSLLKQEKA
jgi:hypothetical protein